MFILNTDHCFVKSLESNDILLCGCVGSDGLYQFSGLPFMPKHFSNSSINFCNNATISNTFTTSNAYTWNLRLRHPNINLIHIALQNCNIPFSTKNFMPLCFVCCMGKAHELSSQPFLTVCQPCRGLYGHSPVSSSTDFSYYVSFVNAYSHRTRIYFLKTRISSSFYFSEL